MEKKSVELKSRVSPEFKAAVDLKAKRAGITTSEYIRLACGDESKVIILEDSKIIAQKLCELCTLLEAGITKSIISSSESSKLLSHLEDCYKTFNAIYDKLPELTLDTDTEEEE